MKSSYALVASSLVAATSAIHLNPRTDNPRVVHAPIAKKSNVSPVTHDALRFRKRASTVQETLNNELTLYYANITLGTPAQSLQLSIDTGSSDLWVNTPNSAECQSRKYPCEGGTYSQSSSSTAKVINTDFNISYVDGSGASGDYVSDVLTFGGTTLNNFQFGVGSTSSSQQGVLGIGYAINEVQTNRYGLSPYANLPLALVDAGKINSAAYSLWLNDLDASTGSILFGGVDTAKYSGQLTTVPIIPTDGIYYELAVALSGVSIGGTSMGSSSDLPLAAVLDSGTSLIYLPNDITQNIYNKVGVTVQDGQAYGYCENANANEYLTFTFSGKQINVAMSELYIPLGETFQNGKEACIFGVAAAGDSTPLLGDTFLRSAYVVYDLARNEISLAQTDYNATSSNIQEITNGTTLVPGAVVASTTITSLVNAATGNGRVPGVTGSVPSGSSPSTNVATSMHMSVLPVVVSALGVFAGVAAFLL